MFGIGPTELLIVGFLALVLFGPQKLISMARDFGRFVSGAQDTVEEFKSELISDEVKEARRTAKEFKSELISARHSINDEFKKGKLHSGEDQK
jgi:TatA/E family protein of Tat protein translocase